MYNHYALITGASEGLGKHLAIECAIRKINMVLVALPGSGLMLLANYLTKNYGIRVSAIEQDLSSEKSCYQLYNKIKEEGITISVLINNAGMGGTFSFDQKRADYYTKIISLNVITPTVLCRLFLDDLKSNRQSYIMNVSSLAGMMPLPKKQVYGGTKSYVLSFSSSLRRELRKEKVSVSTLCPGGINTNWKLTMANRTSGTWLSRQSIMQPDKVAAIAIDQMFKNKALIIPGFWNHLFLFTNKIFPQQLKNWLMEYQMNRVNTQREVIPSFAYQQPRTIA